MIYLNQFKPDSAFLDESISLQDFYRYLDISTLIDTQQFPIKNFDPDQHVTSFEEILILFTFGHNDDTKIEYFTSLNLLDDALGFTAGEMFFNILQVQHKLQGQTCFFQRIEFVDFRNYNGKSIPLYKTYFT